MSRSSASFLITSNTIGTAAFAHETFASQRSIPSTNTLGYGTPNMARSSNGFSPSPTNAQTRRPGGAESFYAWLNHTPSARDLADAALPEQIRDIYQRSRRTYGMPRVHGQLQRRGVRVGKHRVAR